MVLLLGHYLSFHTSLFADFYFLLFLDFFSCFAIGSAFGRAIEPAVGGALGAAVYDDDDDDDDSYASFSSKEDHYDYSYNPNLIIDIYMATRLKLTMTT